MLKLLKTPRYFNCLLFRLFFQQILQNPQKTKKKMLKTCLKKVKNSFQQYKQGLQKQQINNILFDFSQKAFIMATQQRI